MIRLCVIVFMVLAGTISYAAHKNDADVKNKKGSLQRRVQLGTTDKESIHPTDWKESESELHDFKVKNLLGDYPLLLEKVKEAGSKPVVFEDNDPLKKKLEKYTTALRYNIDSKELKQLKKKYHDIPLEDKEKYAKTNQLSYAWKLRLEVPVARQDYQTAQLANQKNESSGASAQACSAPKK